MRSGGRPLRPPSTCTFEASSASYSSESRISRLSSDRPQRSQIRHTMPVWGQRLPISTIRRLSRTWMCNQVTSLCRTCLASTCTTTSHRSLPMLLRATSATLVSRRYRSIYPSPFVMKRIIARDRSSMAHATISPATVEVWQEPAIQDTPHSMTTV